MNRFLNNGSIEVAHGVWGNGLHTTLAKEIPLSDPDYLRYTAMMTTEDELKARKAHDEYLAKHVVAS